MKNAPTPSREDIIALREQGMKRDEIAAFYGVTVSRVKRWIKNLDVPPPKHGQSMHARSRSKQQHRAALDLDDGLTLVERARRILGERFGQDYRGYLLDGRPVRVDILVKAAGLEIKEVA